MVSLLEGLWNSKSFSDLPNGRVYMTNVCSGCESGMRIIQVQREKVLFVLLLHQQGYVLLTLFFCKCVFSHCDGTFLVLL